MHKARVFAPRSNYVCHHFPDEPGRPMDDWRQCVWPLASVLRGLWSPARAHRCDKACFLDWLRLGVPIVVLLIWPDGEWARRADARELCCGGISNLYHPARDQPRRVCLMMTFRQLSFVLMAALLLSTVFFPASKARGQQDQTTGGLGIRTRKVVAWAPNTTDPKSDANTLPDAPSVGLQPGGQIGPALSGATNNPG